MGETLFHGAAADRLKRFTDRRVAPLLKAIREAGTTLDKAGLYAWALHAPERNAQMQKVNPPGSPTNLSGMFNNQRAAIAAGQPGALDAQTVIRDARREPNFPQMQKIAQMIHQITEETRQLLVREGLEDKGTIAAWQKAYKNYVPLFRDAEDMVGDTGRGFQIRGPESRRAIGSTREAQAIVAAVLSQHERAIMRAEKAKVGRQLIKLAEQHPQPDFWKVDTPPTKRMLNPQTGMVQTQIDPLWKNRDDVYLVKERDAKGNVVERALVFNRNNPRAMELAKAMKNMGMVNIDGITKVMLYATRYFARLATSWNPEFWLTNAIRDVQTAIINTQSTELKGKAPQVIASIPLAMGGIFNVEFRGQTGSKWSTYYQELKAIGGTTAFIDQYEDLTERNKAMLKEIQKGMRDGRIDPRVWANWSVDQIDKANSLIENSTRLAAYGTARENGVSQKRAARLAKELTVNFNRKGNRGVAMSAWYMFANAGVQGTARLVEALKSSNRARAYAGFYVALGAAVALLSRVIGDDNKDKDGNNPYDLINEDVKQRNLVFLVPPEEHAGAEDYGKLPLPYGYNVFVNIGRLSADTYLSASHNPLVTTPVKPLDSASSMAKVFADAFVPLGGAPDVLQFFAPTIADPVVQYASNKTWFGAPLRPDPKDYGPPQPNYKLFFRSTSETAKDLSKWLSNATGGDEFKGGGIDVSPTTLEHIFNTATGGTGRSVLGAVDLAKHVAGKMEGTAEPKDMPLQKIPFVGRLAGEITDQERLSQFYRLRKQATEVGRRMKAYDDAGMYDRALAEAGEQPGLAAMSEALSDKDFKKESADYTKRYAEIEQLPRGERVKARKALDREMEDLLISDVVRAYNEAQRAKPLPGGVHR